MNDLLPENQQSEYLDEVMIFVLDFDLQRLGISYNLYVDGTFLRNFQKEKLKLDQVLIIGSENNGQVYPRVFALLKDSKKETYQKVFSVLKERMNEFIFFCRIYSKMIVTKIFILNELDFLFLLDVACFVLILLATLADLCLGVHAATDCEGTCFMNV